jgi:hypothetical protein
MNHLWCVYHKHRMHASAIVSFLMQRLLSSVWSVTVSASLSLALVYFFEKRRQCALRPSNPTTQTHCKGCTCNVITEEVPLVKPQKEEEDEMHPQTGCPPTKPWDHIRDWFVVPPTAKAASS